VTNVLITRALGVLGNSLKRGSLASKRKIPLLILRPLADRLLSAASAGKFGVQKAIENIDLNSMTLQITPTFDQTYSIYDSHMCQLQIAKSKAMGINPQTVVDNLFSSDLDQSSPVHVNVNSEALMQTKV
jgi:hypothetical protein